MDMKGFFAFEGLTDFERMTFVSACRTVELPEDEAIVTQGERMDGLYFVTDGGLRVHVDAGGVEQELALLAAPCLVGELELFVDAPVAATVTAIEPVSALVMPYAGFSAAPRRQRPCDLQDCPELGCTSCQASPCCRSTGQRDLAPYVPRRVAWLPTRARLASDIENRRCTSATRATKRRDCAAIAGDVGDSTDIVLGVVHRIEWISAVGFSSRLWQLVRGRRCVMEDALNGRIALVTGASRGIGRAIAVALAEHGVQVALVARSREGLADTARACEAHGVRTLVLTTDLTDMDRHVAGCKPDRRGARRSDGSCQQRGYLRAGTC